jgi:hypothetical protein
LPIAGVLLWWLFQFHKLRINFKLLNQNRTALKKFTLLFGALLFFFATSNAQLHSAGEKSASESTRRCATMDRVDILMQNVPEMKAASQRSGIIPAPISTPSSFRTGAIVTIPVVVHIVLPNPNSVTDADVNSQIQRLNLDFSGLNADSTNAGAFQSVRGHSEIRFTLARRSPTGTLTTGIQRRASNTGSNVNLATDPIKVTASGGLDAWNTTEYFNIWVGNDASGQGVLGYAQFPGTGSAAMDGVFLNYQAFGDVACNNIPIYNRGRTGTHEVGHYLGLFHIWGDEGGCNGDDFRPLSAVGSTCNLPVTLANPPGQGNTPADIGDTPNQAGATTNCPAGTVTDACSNTAPGKMYQNYMDYTQDNCYSMFTKKQVARMQWVLDNCRAGLKTSLGATPPAGAITRDAAPAASVNPGGSEQVGCGSIIYPSTITCAGAFSPKVRIINNGLNQLNSVTVGMIVNNGAPTTVNVNPNLAFGATAVVTFPSINVTVGSYTFKYYTTNANGAGPDQAPANDTITATLTVAAPATLPVVEGFESTTFPPPGGWTIFNPNGNNTWIRVSPGRNSSFSMAIDNYNNNAPGNIDDLRTPQINTGGTDSVYVNFDVAHKNFPGSIDSLLVLVSNNCGQTFQYTTYRKGGAGLATAGSSTAAYTSPAAGDWRRERVAIGGPILSGGSIMIAFRVRNDYGNNIFIDNINIEPRTNRNIKLESINVPGASQCTPNFTPNVTVRNEGSETVTQFKVGYRIGTGANTITTFNQSIAPNATVTVNLPPVTAPQGTSTFVAFTADPVTATGTGDALRSNDTLTKDFTIATLVSLPVIEGFEGAFPPPGWTIFNQANNAYTWVRRAPGRNSGFSAFIQNFNNATNDIDEMRIPALRVVGDSVIFSFDVAHKNYNTGNNQDTLSVLMSTDCGNTFTTVYKKWGTALSTGGTSTAAFTSPAPNEWRRERIAIGGATISSGNVVFRVRSHSRFGNNIFVDNVNIEEIFRRDIAVTEIKAPAEIACSATPVSPVVTITNRGFQAVTSFKVTHVFDGGAPQTTNVTGVTLNPGQSMDVTLASITPAIGSHNIVVYSSDPVGASGTGDQRTSNDTLRKNFFVTSSTAVPLTETFEGTSFPPTGWGISNADGGRTWERTTLAARSGSASAFLRGYKYAGSGNVDKLVSPVLTQPTASDSIFVSFDLAYSAGQNYPGSTNLPLDTLEVLITRDCGATFTSVYKKWGEDLQTMTSFDGQNNSNPDEFIPNSDAMWRNIRLHVSPAVGTGSFQVYINAITNGQNNIYLDNINVFTRTLPERLKAQGHLIYPSPFTSSFRVHHLTPPTTLTGLAVFNSAGQQVFEKAYNGGAATEEFVNLGHLPRGVYMVKLIYLNKVITERVVKQ